MTDAGRRRFGSGCSAASRPASRRWPTCSRGGSRPPGCSSGAAPTRTRRITAASRGRPPTSSRSPGARTSSRTSPPTGRSGVLFCDTDAMTTGIWHVEYLGRRDAAVEALGADRHYDLSLLLEPDIPWRQDGMRDSDRARRRQQAALEDRLAELGQTAVAIGGDLDERLDIAERPSARRSACARVEPGRLGGARAARDLARARPGPGPGHPASSAARGCPRPGSRPASTTATDLPRAGRRAGGLDRRGPRGRLVRVAPRRAGLRRAPRRRSGAVAPAWASRPAL